MKFSSVSLFIVSFLFLTACQNDVEVRTVDTEEGISVVSNEDTDKAIEEQKAEEEVVTPIGDSKDYQVEVSSVLIDDTEIGFNYEGQMVADNDFSTAWCPIDGGIGAKISYMFNSPVSASSFGIVPGFARDEAIYQKNNRLKTVAIYLDEVKFKEFELSDGYGMQFIDFGEEKTFKKITLEVVAVYKGSKYDDTCVSEWDFWSDYEVNKDADAALNYYNNYKKNDALKPYDLVGNITISDNPPAACKEPEAPSSAIYEEDGVMKYLSNKTKYSTLYFTAYINEYGVANENLDVELYYKGYNKDWYLNDSAFEWPIVESCGGNLYQHIKVHIGHDSAYLIKIYNKGKLVGSKELVTK